MKILHHFFSNGGITLILSNGATMHETTPDSQTGWEHLKDLKRRLRGKA